MPSFTCDRSCRLGPAILAIALLVAGCAFKKHHAPGQTIRPAELQRAVDIDEKQLATDLAAVCQLAASNDNGTVYQPAMASQSPDDLAVAVALVDGRIFSYGDTKTRFPLQSIAKAFTWAAALKQNGVRRPVEQIGIYATGLPYNSYIAIGIRPIEKQNPLVNAGAIATHGLIRGKDATDKLQYIIQVFSELAAKPLTVNSKLYAEQLADGTSRNRGIAWLMKDAGLLQGDPEDCLKRYLAACSIDVNVVELATMGNTLANDGINPHTRKTILSPIQNRYVLSAMATAGMYESCGMWWARVGLPAKSGVGGGIIAVVPGWGAIAVYSPKLDAVGNSVRGAMIIEQLTDRWHLHSFDRLTRAAPAAATHQPRP